MTRSAWIKNKRAGFLRRPAACAKGMRLLFRAVHADADRALEIGDRGVAGSERVQAVLVLDRRQDGGRVVLAMVDAGVLELRRDGDRGDTRAGAPLVARTGRTARLTRRRHVI